MTKPEIIVICLICFILLFVAITYFLHGRKVDKKAKPEKKSKEKSGKTEEKEFDDKVATPPEEKPVPVGIIREEKPSESIVDNASNQIEEYDLAPLKDKPINDKTSSEQSSLKDEIKNLSPEMKKVIMSDLLKPKF